MSVRVTTLPSGLRIVTQDMPHLESAAIGIWVGAGSRSERDDEHGLSHLLEHMAFKGTKTRSAADIAEEIEAVGGEVNAATSVETTSYYARILKADVPLALDILSDILRNSVFDPGELEREQHVILQEIGAALDAPEDRVYDIFAESAFPDQPIGRNILGTAETVKAAASPMLGSYLDRHYRGPAMVVAAAGAVDHDQLVDLANRSLADLAGEAGPDAGGRNLSRRRDPRGARPDGDPDHARLPGHSLWRRRFLHRAGALLDHRRRHVVAALPGGPREARALLLDLRLPLELRRYGRLRRARRDRTRGRRTS